MARLSEIMNRDFDGGVFGESSGRGAIKNWRRLQELAGLRS